MPLPLLPRGVRLARTSLHVLLAIATCFVLLLLASSLWQSTASLRALDGLNRQAARVEHLDRLLIQLMEAENAVRGYLLNGSRAHLEPYERSQATVNQTLEEIRLDFGVDRSHDEALADLSGLVAIKLRSLDQAIERGFAGEETRLAGRRYTERIRSRILGLKEELASEGQQSFERSTRHVERTRWVIALLAAGMIVLMAVLVVALGRQFRLREQLAGLLHSENRRLDALVRERTAELSELASYLTSIRETEKARLARELHDELGALLTAAKMDLGWLARQPALPAATRERLNRLDELLDDGIRLKRRIIDGLRPPLLEELGLVCSLQMLGDAFVEETGLALQCDLPEVVPGLPPDVALALYRIAQEALTNIRRHAAAHQVRLSLRAADGELELIISDDGRGFPASMIGARHHGLAGMKHRVQMCAGHFELASAPGQGTRITARVPLVAAPA